MASFKSKSLPIQYPRSYASYALGFMARVFVFVYGLAVLVVCIVRSRFMNRRFRVMDKADQAQLAIARDRLWNLEKEPFGLMHNLCRLRSSMKLHYVVSKPPYESKGNNALVILLHGFADSWFVWQLLLRNTELRSSTTFVAVDLPGYGGSDDLDVYDADNVLEVLSEFVIKMRDIHAPRIDGSQPPVIIAGHDWGATIAFRLASEAPALADRFIISNSFHVSWFSAAQKRSIIPLTVKALITKSKHP